MVSLLAATCVLFSCSKEPVSQEQEKEKDTFSSISFNLTSREFNISETPLSKAGDPKDWYAFQVYSRPSGTQDSYEYYAYGFFDNKADMIINLKDGYEYKFDVCMFVEASEKVYKFCLLNAGWTPVNNAFILSSTESVRYMYGGYLFMNYPTWDTYDRPRVDRLMGRTEGYIPQEGGTVNIELKRVAFGAKFVPTNFTTGSLEISIEGSGTITMDAGVDTEKQEIISFAYPGRAYDTFMEGKEYSEDIPVNVVWIKEDGVRTPIANQSVSFKRNILTTVEFEVKENASSSSINLSGNESLQDGSSVVIGGDGTNTGVDPQ